MSPRKTAIYLRQSLDRDQNRLAITRQREDCQKLCQQRGWADVVEYVDNSVSATSKKPRPAYQEMLADIRDGKISAVVAWDADRLHRVPRELEDFIDLADQHKLSLATVGGDFDLSTPTGRGNARMKGVFARMEMEQKGVRQRRAAQQKAERGMPQWRRAFGYRDAGGHVRDPDPATAPLVRQAYAAMLAGASLSEVARLFNEAGAYGLNGKPWTESTVSLFLRAPRNAGLRAHRGEIVGKATWPGLVSESVWRATQAVLNAPGRAPGRKSVRKHLLTGVLRCGKEGCDGYLAGRWVMQKTGGKPGRPKAGHRPEPRDGQVSHVITYTCKTCRGVSIRADFAEKLLCGLVGDRLAKPDAVDLLKAKANDEKQAEKIRDEISGLYGELDTIGRERGEGLLTGQQAKIATEIIQAKITELERREQDQERLRVLEGIPLGTPQATEKVDELRRTAPDRFRAVVAVVMIPTVLPVGKGSKVPIPDRLVPNYIATP
ncbi:recombinase family protein [Mycobacterium sp. CPCC 205372]|uniref:Recombinase family protein n=1 Tax=Mycobacterium hippophais TaxID=3016340 RepID=A0ABT4PV22_9MYCO|nr:recombinase family protein [Mycobacterium hippophais]MCZ8380349.1 recombinase family protein [Mycobacterium hippophais]